MSIHEWLISVFIVAFCLADLAICSPPSPLREACFEAIHPVLDYASLCCRFNMFSPTPPKSNYWLESDITFANGQTKPWRFPEQQAFFATGDFWLPQVKVRHQYWQSYVARAENYPLTLPGAAKYAAQSNFDKANPPIKVRLYRLSKPILLPGEVRASEVLRQQLFEYDLQGGTR